MNLQAQIDLDAVSVALKLDGPLSISSVEGLQEVLTRYVGHEADLQLDLSGIDACDAAGLQLLCSLRKSAAALGKSFRIVAVSEPFTALALSLGIPAESLALPASQAADGLPLPGAANQGDRDGF